MPTPTPVPWTLKGAIDKLPEVYTEAVTPETVEQYAALLSALPEEAQWWITGMGWGLEDLALDANEVALLELLAEKNVPTAMSILTSPDVIDGVTVNEVTWAQDHEVESLEALLQDDVDELLTQGLLTEERLEGINGLIEMAATDFEVAKGLCLIDNFGHPDSRLFAYTIPKHNTQLYALLEYVSRGVPEGHMVTALARAMNAGTWIAISGDELASEVVDYHYDLLLYQTDTDKQLDQAGAAWNVRSLPLEAQLTLCGTTGLIYPGRAGEDERGFLGPTSVLRSARYRRLDGDDWDYLSADIANLYRTREFLIARIPLGSTVSAGDRVQQIENDSAEYLDAWKSYPPATVTVPNEFPGGLDRNVVVGEEYAADWGLLNIVSDPHNLPAPNTYEQRAGVVGQTDG